MDWTSNFSKIVNFELPESFYRAGKGAKKIIIHNLLMYYKLSIFIYE
jgi:hypothetical protein